MGEEMEHARQASIVKNGQARFWTLDPLDGTTNFAMGFPFYGVSLALVTDGEVELGVVYDPVRDECFHAVSGGGAFLNGQLLQTVTTGIELDACVANVDLKRLVGQLAERLVRYPPYRSQRNLGACVLEWCWMAAGRIQLYLHGGQQMWDYAAGSLILQEAGGVFSTVKGLPLDCQLFTKRSVVAAINQDLYQQWFHWISENDKRGVSVSA
jgi:myo-inositol-1(or 4)-monophosphatase